jgi:hypothetical protein
VETADVRQFAEQVDRVLAEDAPDSHALERMLDSAQTVANALEGETTRLHREIDRAVDEDPAAIGELNRELRECYRDLELLRPRARALTLRLAERRLV